MERDTMFMESKLQYYKDVPPFQIDPYIYFVTLKNPKRCLFWQVSIEEWIVELDKFIFKCIRADSENQWRK